MTPAALAQLLQLMEARKSRDLAQLDRLLTEDRALAEELAALARLPAQDLEDDPDLSPMEQARRLAWAEQRRRTAERRRSVLATEIRAARAIAVRSLGKHRALEHLGDRAAREAVRTRLARAEREAPPAVPRRADG